MPPSKVKVPPIAMMHAVRDSTDISLQDWRISTRAFLRLLDHLEATGYTTTSFTDLIENKDTHAKRVILTFDDCLKHLLDFAVPQLIKRKMKAAFYMPTAFIGRYNVWDFSKGAERLDIMNEGDIRELVRCGMEIGSHSHNHIELRSITDREKLKEEIVTSKAILESIIQGPVYSFAYPYGSVPQQHNKLLTSAGYRFGVGIYHPFETNMALRRFGVYEKDTPQSLNRKLSGSYKWFRKVYDVVKKY